MAYSIMSDVAVDPDFDYGGFAQRLKEAIAPEKLTPFASRIGVPQATLSKYVNGQGTGPRLDVVAKVASGAGVSIDWLVWGRGEGRDPDVIRIPRYDVTLAAGAGSWNDGKRQVELMPFTGNFLRTQLRRQSAAGLAVLEARGDSMMPTIQDRSLLIVDQNDTRLIDDVFAFVLAGDARIKRFKRLQDGVQIISDNASYPVEELRLTEMSDLQVVGRAIWVGQPI